MKKLEVNNCWGYPSLTPRIKEFAKSVDALLVIGTANLLKFKAKDLLSTKPKIIIEAVPGLEAYGIPVIGYAKAQLRYLKCDLALGAPRVRKIKVPTNHRRLPSKMFAEILAAPSKRAFIDALDPKAETTGIAKSMLSPILRASPNDPVPTRKGEVSAETPEATKTVNKMKKAKKGKA